MVLDSVVLALAHNTIASALSQTALTFQFYGILLILVIKKVDAKFIQILNLFP